MFALLFRMRAVASLSLSHLSAPTSIAASNSFARTARLHSRPLRGTESDPFDADADAAFYMAPCGDIIDTKARGDTTLAAQRDACLLRRQPLPPPKRAFYQSNSPDGKLGFNPM